MLFPPAATFALLLLGAHFLRIGYPVRTAVCIALALLAWSRQARARLALSVLLWCAATHWIWTAGQLTQWRRTLQQPWQRMAVLVPGVAVFTMLAALAGTGEGAKARYLRKRNTARVQAASFLFVFGALAAMSVLTPHLLPADILYPGLGAAQALALGPGAAWMAGRMNGGRRAQAVLDGRGSPLPEES